MILVLIACMILAIPVYLLVRIAAGLIEAAYHLIRGHLEPEDDQWPDT